MIFQIDKQTNRASVVFLPQDIKEEEYYKKYKEEDNLYFCEKPLENVDLSLPLILKDGVIINDINFLKQVEKESKTEYVVNMLNITDKYMLSDFPISKENKEEIIIFRQGLRDFSKNGILPDTPAFLQNKD